MGELKEIINIINNVDDKKLVAEVKNIIKASDVINAVLFQRYLKLSFSDAHKIMDYLVKIEAIEKYDGTARARKIYDKNKILKLFEKNDKNKD